MVGAPPRDVRSGGCGATNRIWCPTPPGANAGRLPIPLMGVFLHARVRPANRSGHPPGSGARRGNAPGRVGRAEESQMTVTVAGGVDRVDLPIDRVPERWYNVVPDLPRPLDDYLDPETGAPVADDYLETILPRGISAQERSLERWVEIPPDV